MRKREHGRGELKRNQTEGKERLNGCDGENGEEMVLGGHTRLEARANVFRLRVTLTGAPALNTPHLAQHVSAGQRFTAIQ